MQIDLQDTKLTFQGTPTWKLVWLKFFFQRLLPRLTHEDRRGRAFGEKWAMRTLKIPVIGHALVRHIGPFPHFCGGVDIDDCDAAARRLGKRNVRSILDYSAEGLGREEDFDATRDEVLHVIEHSGVMSGYEPFAVFKVTGLGDKHVLEKASSGEALTPDEQASLDRTVARVRRICEAASAVGLRVLIDAEESWIQQAIDDIAEQMMQELNRERALVYTTIQMYRVDRPAYLAALYDRSVARGYFAGVKLVRGAYMEKERERAEERGLPSPIQPTKEATDAAFDAAVEFVIQRLDRMALVAGTHNDASVARLVQLMDRHGIAAGDPRVECSQLLGMSDNLSFGLAGHGYNASKYVPYGPLEGAIPYLIRRAHENSSIVGQTDREVRLVNRELARRWPALFRRAE